MTKRDYQLNLIDAIEQLTQAKKHLEASFSRCENFSLDQLNSEDKMIEFEALTSRFARTTDMLIHKVYRSIDSVELVEAGTLIDVINRAEKRNLIDSATVMRAMKDVRNDIAHEYISERLCLLHDEVFKYVPTLISYIDRVCEYAKQYTQ